MFSFLSLNLNTNRPYICILGIGLEPACKYGHLCKEYLTNKEALTVLCSVVKHAGSGRAQKKSRGKHEEMQSSVFLYFLSALSLPVSALQQNEAKSRLLYLFYNKELKAMSFNNNFLLLSNRKQNI